MNLKQLAEHLGLSQTTVSRALNGYPEVGAETRRRVDEAARKLGYRPNPYAMRLATGRANAIGHVLPADKALLIDAHFMDFIAGAGDYYSSTGFDVMLHVGGPENEEAVYRRYAQTGAVDGVVVMGPRISDWRIDFLKELKLPFIVHGRVAGTELGYAWMDIDNRGAFHAAGRHLTGLGHRRIGFINGDERMTFAAHRREGYDMALREAGIETDLALVSAQPMTEENGYRESIRLLSLAERPTALMLSSMLMVSGAIRACHELRLEIGRDVSLIAHDDGLPFLNAEGLSPRLSTVRSSIRDAGNRVAELLVGMINDPDAALPHELWPVELIPRGSTGPAP